MSRLVLLMLLWLVVGASLIQAGEKAPAPAANRAYGGRTISLDGVDWLLGIDPENVGKSDGWFSGPRVDARPTRVPWVIQDAFPDYHGVAWYWREFSCPANPDRQGRYLLRFWNVDYLGEVWVNDKFVGRHEGADGPFELDVTDAVLVGGKNRLAVRVLNPKDEPIDGFVLAQTPHRNKTCAFTFGCDYNHGGLEDSVELIIAPAVRIVDLHVKPDPESGEISVDATINNSLTEPVDAKFIATVAPARDGETIDTVSISQRLQPGANAVACKLTVQGLHRWELDDPYLYRVSADARTSGSEFGDGKSTRCGFRDFRVKNGYFQLNGRRLFLRSSHTGNTAPIGIHLPFNRDWFRQDLLYTKMLGFNMIRVIAGLPAREQIDMCDELGLLVYEEPYSAWLMADSPQMTARFDRSVEEMIRRDGNHPSVVIWGLLNETHDGPVFRHAVKSLSLVRSLDDSRIALLSSGRFDCDLKIGSVSNPGSMEWQALLGGEGLEPTKPLNTIYPSCENSGDAHIYPQVPHTCEAIELLRNYGEGQQPFFLSEYGVGSPVDLVRVTRHYEQRGKESSGEARFYREALDRFMADWERWNMAEVFGRPEEFFAAAQARMASQRLVGINALRANPNCNGYNLTGTVDQGYSGEGLTTAFREFKRGTSDAMYEALAPLRLCAFVEPYHVYRAKELHFRVIVANEDVLPAGDYPLRVDVLDAESKVVYSKKLTVTIPPGEPVGSVPFAINAFDEAVIADWASGKFRLQATFERAAAAAGGSAEFFVTDAADLPSCTAEVVVWGEDPEMREWLTAHGVTVQDDLTEVQRRLIVVSGRSAETDKKASYRNLLKQAAGGSQVIFLTPQFVAEDGWQLPCRGKIAGLPSAIYHKEEWNRRHDVFAGLPAGGLMDYVFYRNLIPAAGWQREGSPPTEIIAGAVAPAPGTGYSNGLLLFADQFAAGKCFVTTLRIRDNLGKDPAADRLLCNLLKYASGELDKPVAPLPAGFQQRLAELGL